jgi:hypothetical protein
MSECVMAVDPTRLWELNLEKEKLRHWVNVSVMLNRLVGDYEQTGQVQDMDMSCAIPLCSVEIHQGVWLMKHLKQ